MAGFRVGPALALCLWLGCRRVFEYFLVDGHHFDVCGGFAVDDALLVDLGPAETEEEALDGDLGVGGGGGEALGLVGGHGPELRCAGGCGWLGEAAVHGDDGLTAVEYLVSRGAEEVVVVGESRLHAGLFDGKQRDEAAFFRSGPHGLRWGEVAELGGADGAGQAGRRGERDADLVLMRR